MSLFEIKTQTPDSTGATFDLNLLNRWVEQKKWLRPLDRSFALFLGSEVPTADPLALLAAALVSYQLGRSHVCLDLNQLSDNPMLTLGLSEAEAGAEGGAGAGAEQNSPRAVLRNVTLEQWQEALTRAPALCGFGVGNTPLVLAGPRLYLRRNWHCERSIFNGIRQRLQEHTFHQSDIQPAAVREMLDQLFTSDPKPEGQAVHWQKVACAVAATRAFSVITGGPGTGKTTTVVRLLALLQALQSQAGAPFLKIRLAAPTGKAAARLSESISRAIGDLNLSALPEDEAVKIRAAISCQVTTLHRLLGRRLGTRHPAYRRGNPLPLDLLVVDEASMIDLEMMSDVIDALPGNARLILLGDKDQLASVEAGAVLGELCRNANKGRYHAQTITTITAASGEQVPGAYYDDNGDDLDQAIVMLRHSYRFSSDKGIGKVATAVNQGDSAAVIDSFNGHYPELTLLKEGDAEFRELVIDGANPDGALATVVDANGPQVRCGYRHYLTTLRNTRPPSGADEAAWNEWAQAVLKAHNQFQVLAAVKKGDYGVEGLNVTIAGLLRKKGLITGSDRADGWYEGRPVMITRNDYVLGLMNGDVGITLKRPGSEPGTTMLRVAFATADGIKWVSPTRLSEVETVFALTVHKSQGSEFTHTLLVLPEKPNPVLTRELFYTAITRSRTWLSLCNPGGDDLLKACVENQVKRASGLLEGE